MARSPLILKIKARASSFVEVLIAMVVILVVFAIAMMIYSNVLRLSLSIKKLKAQAILHDIILQDEKSGGVSARNVLVDEYNVEVKSSIVQGSNGLLLVHLTAYDRNQAKITDLQKIIICKLSDD